MTDDRRPAENEGMPPRQPVGTPESELRTVAEFAAWLDQRLAELEQRFAGHRRQPILSDRPSWQAPRKPR